MNLGVFSIPPPATDKSPLSAGLTSAICWTSLNSTPAVCATAVFALALSLLPHAATPPTADTSATIATSIFLMTILRICDAGICIAIASDSTVLPMEGDGFGGKS